MILPGQVLLFTQKRPNREDKIKEFAFKTKRIAAHKPAMGSIAEKLLILDTIRPHTHISVNVSSKVTVAAINLSKLATELPTNICAIKLDEFR